MEVLLKLSVLDPTTAKPWFEKEYPLRGNKVSVLQTVYYMYVILTDFNLLMKGKAVGYFYEMNGKKIKLNKNDDDIFSIMNLQKGK